MRKSRADIEAEARGEGETLAKHKKALLQLAKTRNDQVVCIRQEIASGEHLIHRPEMLKLLEEVEANLYDAVLVMDLDRLGRGNMREQGLILETFKQSQTYIITPRKVYDLGDEFDEEYSEFEAFMARKELKVITRRLQSGRIRSVEEGNYIGTRPPYGYLIKQDQHGRYLIPHPEQSHVVKMIFDWYTHPDPTRSWGSTRIAQRLNERGFQTYYKRKWSGNHVLNILKNAVYAGRIQWKVQKNQASKSEINVQGKHEPLISMKQYQDAQARLQNRSHSPVKTKQEVRNPLAGIIKCAYCFSTMVYRPYTKQKPHLICPTTSCPNRSSRFEVVEQKLLLFIHKRFQTHPITWQDIPLSEEDLMSHTWEERGIKQLHRRLAQLNVQKNNLHELLETGIYQLETYRMRKQLLLNEIKEIKQNLKALQKCDQQVAATSKQVDIPLSMVSNPYDLYIALQSPKHKNNLLKILIKKCTYSKEKQLRGEAFTLMIYPHL
nr:recombinase family protein [Polycladospora coralii]